MITPRANTPPRAFTLVELIIVIILISVLSALVVPRLGNLGVRAASVEADSIAGLLTAAAQRASLGSEAGALEYTPASRQFALLIQRRTADDQAASWEAAPLSRPVRLERLSLRRAMLPGGVLPGSVAWRAPVGGGVSLGPVSLLLGDGETAWQVDVAEGSLSAKVSRLANEAAWLPGAGVIVDLDAQGRRDKPW